MRIAREETVRLDLPLLLPEVKEAQDLCVGRLVKLVERQDGVVRAHVMRGNQPDAAEGVEQATPVTNADHAQLCLHYDPERLTLAQLTKLARAAGAGVTDRFGHEIIRFHAIASEDSGQRVEAGLRAIPGVTAANVSLAGQIARVEFDKRRVDVAAIRQAMAELGTEPAEPGAAPAAASTDAPAPQGKPWLKRNRELVWSLTSGLLLTAAWAAGRTDGTPGSLPIALFALAYVFGAYDNVGHFIKDLRKGHFHFNIDLLMVVAAVGAAVLGEWLEGALLLFLFSLGHALEHYAMGRARNAIKALAELAPSRATVIRDINGKKSETEVAIEDVKPGDSVVVKPSERIPVDGTVHEGRTNVNQAPITGESMPVPKQSGDPVFAGSVNGDGAIVVTVTSALGDRTLDRVIKLVADAETQKAPTQQFTDRFERIFVPMVLVASALMIVGPPLILNWEWSKSFYRAMALLVAASPCALALGTPAAVLAGIAQAARKGVLIKGGAHLESLGTITTLALDKTGTITKGEPAVTDVVVMSGVTEEELLTAAAGVEQRSQHPLARAIMKASESRSIAVPAASDVESVTGQGVRATVSGKTVSVGRLLMFSGDASRAVPSEIQNAVEKLEANGRTTMVVHHGGGTGVGNWLGVVGIADEPRADVRKTLDAIRDAGIKRIVMLTGDNAGVGSAIAKEVGIDDVRAGLMPEDKVTAITELASKGPIAMVGDGVNDAPALAHATVGIAMGGAGTAAALETADVALMGDDLSRLPFAIGLSRRARGVIKQNLYVSLGMIAFLVLATTTGYLGIAPTVVLHEGSTIVVIINALRLLTYNGPA